MRQRKLKADYLFNGYKTEQKNSVLIIKENGVVLDIVDEKDAGGDIEIFAGILSPAFVNAHCHLELSHLKGATPPKTGLVDFLQHVMTKRALPEEEKLIASKKAEEELFAQGVIAVGDVCNTADTLWMKQQSTMYYHNFIETAGFSKVSACMRFNEMNHLLQQFNGQLRQCRNSLSPHAPYSVSEALFRLLNDATEKQIVSIHNQECNAENELYKNKQGDFLSLYKNFNIDDSDFVPSDKSSVQSWFPWFTHKQSIILVHNTFMSLQDIQFICSQQRSPVYFCLCPNANQYIEQAFPPIDRLRAANCTIVIGTDSYASNRQLNILEELKTIGQKTTGTISLEEMLKWATGNGSEALQLSNVIGSFEKGKKPGVVLIEKTDGMALTRASFSRRII